MDARKRIDVICSMIAQINVAMQKIMLSIFEDASVFQIEEVHLRYHGVQVQV